MVQKNICEHGPLQEYYSFMVEGILMVDYYPQQVAGTQLMHSINMAMLPKVLICLDFLWYWICGLC